jgi:hypothetical protein
MMQRDSYWGCYNTRWLEQMCTVAAAGVWHGPTQATSMCTLAVVAVVEAAGMEREHV